jgi:hypothetical protein
MADVTKSIEANARKLWDMGQRIVAQIAEKPLELGGAASAIVEHQMKEIASDGGIARSSTQRVQRRGAPLHTHSELGRKPLHG